MGMSEAEYQRIVRETLGKLAEVAPRPNADLAAELQQYADLVAAMERRIAALTELVTAKDETIKMLREIVAVYEQACSEIPAPKAVTVPTIHDEGVSPS